MPNALQASLHSLAAALAHDIAAAIRAASVDELLTIGTITTRPDTVRPRAPRLRVVDAVGKASSGASDGASAAVPVKRGPGRPRKVPAAPTPAPVSISPAPELPLTETQKANPHNDFRGVKELLSFLKAKRQKGRTVEALRNHIGPGWTDALAIANQEGLVRHDGASAFAASPFYDDTRYWLK